MQTIKPSWGVNFLCLAKFDKIIFDNHKILITYKKNNTTVDISTIKNYEIKKGFLYNSFILNLKNGVTHKIDGFPSSVIKEFINEFDKYFADTYYKFYYAIACDMYKKLPSKYALDQAIVAEDNNEEIKINRADLITTILNWLSSAFFIIGLVFIIVFVKLNLGDKV